MSIRQFFENGDEANRLAEVVERAEREVAERVERSLTNSSGANAKVDALSGEGELDQNGGRELAGQLPGVEALNQSDGLEKLVAQRSDASRQLARDQVSKEEAASDGGQPEGGESSSAEAGSRQGNLVSVAEIIGSIDGLAEAVGRVSAPADGSESALGGDGENDEVLIYALGGLLAIGGLIAIASGGGGDGDRPEPVDPPAQNRAPTGNDVGSVNEGSQLSGNLASNDMDPDGDTLAYSLNAPVAGLAVNANGTYSFDANNAAYNGLAAGETDIVNYTVSDGKGGTATATLTITVTGTNDAPVAVADVAAATEDGPVVTGSVAANDSDPDGDTLSYALDAPVAGLTLNADGSYSFDPTDAAYNGLAAGETEDVVATYTVSDGNGGTATSTLTITVTGTNDAPVITSGTTAQVDENQPAGTVVYQAGATDPDGDVLVYSLAGVDAADFTIDPRTGTVTQNQSLDFEDQANYNFTVIATDPDGLNDSVDVVLTVNNQLDVLSWIKIRRRHQYVARRCFGCNLCSRISRA